MNWLTLFDAISLAAVASILVVLLTTRWTPMQRDIRWIMLLLAAIMLFDRFSNLLEWSGITPSLDRAEGYLEIAQPLLWGVLLYGLLQKEVRKRLQASEERYRTLVENIDLGISLVDADYRVVATNPAQARLFQRRAESLVGSRCYSVHAEDARNCGECPGRQSMETGLPGEETRELTRTDGTTFTGRIRTFPVFDKHDEPTGFIEVVEDVTERRRHAAELEQRARRLEILFEVSQAVLSGSPPREVAQQVLSRGVDLLSATRASVVLFSPDTRKATMLCVWPPDRAMLEEGTFFHFPEDSQFQNLRRLEPVILDEEKLARTQDPRLRELLDAGVRSVLAIPLQYREELLGSLNFAAPEPGHFTPARIQIAREAANILAIGLHNYRAAEALEHENTFRETLINKAAEGIAVCHATGARPFIAFTVWNQRMEEITGYTREQMNTIGLEESVHPEPLLQERALSLMDRIRKGEDLVAEEWEIQSRKGKKKILSISTSVIIDQEGVVHVLGVMTDITERRHEEEEKRRFDEQVRHTQKLESLGVLAGGIAHDFNNLLVSILGNTDMALKTLPPGHHAGDYLKDVQSASQRAADLCRQLLAYSGKGRFQIERLDLNRLVREMTEILSVSISKNAELQCHLTDDLPPVRADISQIQQVVMNLIVNASEALVDGVGLVHVETGLLAWEGGLVGGTFAADSLQPGEYVTLEVRDNGCGMSEESLQRLFEPFYTTKFTGRGLGMSAVLGIIRGHEGAIEVNSTPGQGTRIRVLLPADRTPQTARAPADAARPADVVLSGTALVVDDEEVVRKLAQRMLEWMGMKVRTAADGIEALDVLREESAITVVLLDLTMPRMDGAETLVLLRKDYPHLPVLMTSGYDQDEMSVHNSSEKPDGFLKKPFTSDKLQSKLEQVLARSPRAASRPSPSG